MLNNNVQSEFEKFIEGPNEKLMLGVDKRICIKYSFFTQSSNQNKVIDFLSSVSKNCKGIVLEYKMIETKKKSELDNIKVSVDLIFQKLPIKQRQCFFYIAGILFQIKLALDNFTEDKLPKSLEVRCGFFVKNLQKYNNISVKYEEDNEFIEYFDKLLPSKYTKYTLDVNYGIETYKNFILFDAFCGNIENVGMSEIYYEIVNNIIVFNNDIVKGIRK